MQIDSKLFNVRCSEKSQNPNDDLLFILSINEINWKLTPFDEFLDAKTLIFSMNKPLKCNFIIKDRKRKFLKYQCWTLNCDTI